MPAPDALVLKAELREDLDRNAAMRQMIQAFIDSTQGRTMRSSGGPAPDNTFDASDTAASICERYRLHLDLAEAFYVAPSLLDLVKGAAISMPDETLLPQDLPADTGFLWVPGGFQTYDVRGQQMSVNAITWHRHGDGVEVAMWTDKHDPVDAVAAGWRGTARWNDVPRLTLCDRKRIRFGHDLPHQITIGADVPPELGAGMKFTVADTPATDGADDTDGPGEVSLKWTWNGDRPLDEVLADHDMTHDEFTQMFSPTPGPNPILRCLLATWRLMQQTMTTVEKEEVPRNVRRRLERMNVPEKHVSVIGLRKRPSHGDGTSDVQWSHRWVVRGHWRRTPYKDPESGETVYRHIYINPHIKGPDSAPLLIRDRVYALVR